jgi:hypothetical protein
MSVLEQARKAFARIKTQRNGHPEASLDKGQTGDISVQCDQSPLYLLVDTAAGLDMIVTALDNTDLVALDLETTGLDPRTDRVRLLSLATDTIDGGTFSYLVDAFQVDPSPLWEALTGKELVASRQYIV